VTASGRLYATFCAGDTDQVPLMIEGAPLILNFLGVPLVPRRH
jgi:hypothetical protein